jgi:ABC-2 type transport system ATP-binding protein
MKRRLMIARALIHDPKLLSSMSQPPASTSRCAMRCGTFLQKINKEGTTIVLTTHYLEEAEQLCKNVAMINKGEIVLNESMRKLIERHGEAKLESIYLDLIKREGNAKQL